MMARKNRAADVATTETTADPTTTTDDVTTLEPTPNAADVATTEPAAEPILTQETVNLASDAGEPGRIAAEENATTDAEPTADESDILYDAAYDAVSAYITRGFAAVVADRRAEAETVILDVDKGLAALEAAGINGSAKAALMARRDEAVSALDATAVDEAEVSRRVDMILDHLAALADPATPIRTSAAGRTTTPQAPRASAGDTDRTAEKYRAVADGTELHGSNCNQLGTLAWNRLHLRSAGAKVIADAFAAQYGGDSLASYLARRGLPLREVKIRCPEGHEHILQIGPLAE